MADLQPRNISGKPMREVCDTRTPLYIVFILDTSSSMYDFLSVNTVEGETKQVRKIEELNQGLGDALNSLRCFEAGNALYRVYYQIIELNRYGRALFPDFVPLSLQSKKICFEADGVTCLENSLSTLKTFLDPKHMPGCNRAVNVILMSDGYPTDAEGYMEDDATYKKTIQKFKDYLEERGLRPNIDLYSIRVGEDACEEMLATFADAGKYYVVEELESLAEKLDFVTQKSLIRLTPRTVKASETAEDDRDNGALVDAVTLREVDISKCLGSACLACVDICALSAIQYENGILKIRSDLCIGCGGCDDKCPAHAIYQVDEDICDDLI